jgi:hypothetical protein
MKLSGAFSTIKNTRLTPKGNAGYDNARENIDPKILTRTIIGNESIFQRGIFWATGDYVPLIVRGSAAQTANLTNFQNNAKTNLMTIDKNAFCTWYLQDQTTEKDPFAVYDNSIPAQEIWMVRVINRIAGNLALRGHELYTSYTAPTDDISLSGGAWFRFVDNTNDSNFGSLDIGIVPTAGKIGFHGYTTPQCFIGSQQTGSATLLPLVFNMDTVEKFRLATNGNLCLTGVNIELRFYEGVNFVAIKVPALGSDTTYVLPATDGGPGDRLTTDGAGNLSWQP